MIGIAIGALCGLALFKTLRHRHPHYSQGHGCHHRRWGPPWRPAEDSGRSSRGPMLARLLRSLDVSDEQEAAISPHIKTFRKRMKTLGKERHLTRSDLGKAMASPDFDETIMGELFARHDEQLREARKDLVEVMAHVHAILDERQREKLAEFLQGDRGFGPFRDGGWS